MTTDNRVNEIIDDMMARYAMTREQAEAEYDLEIFSDLYKDAHGVRPRWMYEEFRAMTSAQRQEEFVKLEAYFETDTYKEECAAQAAWLEECERAEEVRWANYAAVEAAKADGLPVTSGMTVDEVLAVREGEALYPTRAIDIEVSRGWL